MVVQSETRVPHRNETPTSCARCSNNEWRTVRRKPNDTAPCGNLPVADEVSSQKRIPATGNATFEFKTFEFKWIPRNESAATPSGRSPSPHAFSIGGLRESATVTLSPFSLTAIAVASPAGPAPTIRTSAYSATGPRFYHRKRTNSAQKPGPMAARMLNSPGLGRLLL